jgi:two-component system sensor histidine kinase HydH
MARGFNIRLWFGVAALGAIALISVLYAELGARFVTERLLEREAEVSQEFLESILIAGESAERIFGPDGADSAELAEFGHHVISMPGTLRANIYRVDGTVAWSSEMQLIGQRFEHNDELGEALQGRRVTKVGKLPDADKREHVALEAGRRGHFVETYVPMRGQRGRGPVVGVVELYKLPTALEATIQQGRRTIWLASAGAALILFLALYGIVHRGARQIELQQRELRHMEALAAIGQMASAVAHSLRNPLATIRSSAELARLDGAVESRRIADDVIREVDRMDGYVHELLSYARADSASLQPVDPFALVKTCLSKQQAVLQRLHIEVKLGDQRREHHHVLADPGLLGQALTSIITNAAEAMAGGGRLDVRVVDNQPDSTVSILIADSGSGIPADILARVTEPYFTTKSGGLGLGLAIAKRIVEQFAGRIDIRSAKDQGTTVFVALKPA